MNDRNFSFIGGSAGSWRVLRVSPVAGTPLEYVDRVEVLNRHFQDPSVGARWILRGVTSNERYVLRREQELLFERQPPLGRPEATRAALIPVKKSETWWALAQDERRAIFEERSKHIETGLRYLPAVARRLHHGRDLGEPFDFLTWFEYAPSESERFEELVTILRHTEEWKYVEREVDIRLIREVAA